MAGSLKHLLQASRGPQLMRCLLKLITVWIWWYALHGIVYKCLSVLWSHDMAGSEWV